MLISQENGLKLSYNAATSTAQSPFCAILSSCWILCTTKGLREGTKSSPHIAFLESPSKTFFVHFMFFSYSFFAPKCFQAGIRLFHSDQVCSHRHTWYPLPSSHGRISKRGYKLSTSLPAVLRFFTRYFTYFNAFCTMTPRVFHTFHQLCQHLWALRN